MVGTAIYFCFQAVLHLFCLLNFKLMGAHEAVFACLCLLITVAFGGLPFSLTLMAVCLVEADVLLMLMQLWLMLMLSSYGWCEVCSLP